MQNAMRIISTKTKPPENRGRHVERQAEAALVESILDAPATTIVAPSGFGKTELMMMVYKRALALKCSTAWLSLDEHDSDELRFVSYLLASITRMCDKEIHISEDTLCLSDHSAIEIVASEILESLRELLPSRVFLFIDNYHYVKNNSVNRLFTCLLTYAPKNFRLIISNRELLTSSLPSAFRSSEIYQINADDLRFTLSDTARYLQYRIQEKLPVSTVQHWHRISEGVIFVLKSLEISTRRTGYSLVHDSSLGGAQLINGLIDEILQSLPAPTVDFLLAISVVDIFSNPIARAITSLSESEISKRIQELEDQEIFVERVFDESSKFRLHLIFRENLRSRLKKHNPNGYLQFNARARDWYASCGELQMALRHCIAAGDAKSFPMILDSVCVELINASKVIEIVDYEEYLCEDDFKKFPRLAFVTAIALIVLHRYEQGRKLIKLLESKSFKNADFKEFNGALPILQAYDAFSNDKMSEARDIASGWLNATQDADEYPPVVLGSAYGCIYYGSILAGDFEVVSRLNADVRAKETDFFPIYSYTYFECAEGLAELHLGNLDIAHNHFQSAYSNAEKRLGRFNDYRALPSAFLCEIHYLRGNYEYLINESYPLIPSVARVGTADAVIHSLANIAKTLAITGNQSDAKEVIQKAEAIATSSDWPRVNLAILHARFLIARINGSDFEEKLNSKRLTRSLQQLHYDKDNVVNNFWKEFMKVEQLILDDSIEQAFTNCIAARDNISDRGLTVLLFRINVLLLCILVRRDDTKLLHKTLENCLSYSEQYAVIQPFVENGDRLGTLLIDYQQNANKKRKDLISRIVSKFPAEYGAIVAKPFTTTLGYKLSEREVEILSLVGQGLTNKHIAIDLDIGAGTVKWHLRNIFEKLGVTSRVEAIRKARRDGVID